MVVAKKHSKVGLMQGMKSSPLTSDVIMEQTQPQQNMADHSTPITDRPHSNDRKRPRTISNGCEIPRDSDHSNRAFRSDIDSAIVSSPIVGAFTRVIGSDVSSSISRCFNHSSKPYLFRLPPLDITPSTISVTDASVATESITSTKRPLSHDLLPKKSPLVVLSHIESKKRKGHMPPVDRHHCNDESRTLKPPALLSIENSTNGLEDSRGKTCKPRAAVKFEPIGQVSTRRNPLVNDEKLHLDQLFPKSQYLGIASSSGDIAVSAETRTAARRVRKGYLEVDQTVCDSNLTIIDGKVTKQYQFALGSSSSCVTENSHYRPPIETSTCTMADFSCLQCSGKELQTWPSPPMFNGIADSDSGANLHGNWTDHDERSDESYDDEVAGLGRENVDQEEADIVTSDDDFFLRSPSDLTRVCPGTKRIPLARCLFPGVKQRNYHSTFIKSPTEDAIFSSLSLNTRSRNQIAQTCERNYFSNQFPLIDETRWFEGLDLSQDIHESINLRSSTLDTFIPARDLVTPPTMETIRTPPPLVANADTIFLG